MKDTHKKVRQSRTYRLTIILILAALCVVSTMVCVAVGSVPYTLKQVANVFQLNFQGKTLTDILSNSTAEAWLLVWNVRLPRVICGGLVGICLSLAGCILQGVMRNHLASPSTIGVTSGSSFVAYLTLVAFPQFAYLLPIGSIVGSFATTMVIYILAYEKGVSPVKMILSGMAVSAMFGAFNDIIRTFFSEELHNATGQLVGSLNGVVWKNFYLIAPYVLVGIIVCFFLPSKMNILMLGDEMANSLGLRTE